MTKTCTPFQYTRIIYKKKIWPYTILKNNTKVIDLPRFCLAMILIIPHWVSSCPMRLTSFVNMAIYDVINKVHKQEKKWALLSQQTCVEQLFWQYSYLLNLTWNFQPWFLWSNSFCHLYSCFIFYNNIQKWFHKGGNACSIINNYSF